MAKNKKQTAAKIVKRPPVVVVMGHIDHGKSTLLDYIRHTDVTKDEAGGITQHLSAYVVTHKSENGVESRLTFLDTPGHAAFQKMRLRGADVADVAILVVSAEDGVKPQTLEALESIKQANIPYVVAINKIDKPAANLARTQASLIENEIYLEGMGGDIPFAPISAKTGQGVPELLDLVILSADLAELEGDLNTFASGVVIEGYKDDRRGATATLIVKNGTLKSGAFVVAGEAMAPVRIMEDSTARPIKEAGLSEPVRIVGFTTVPIVGSQFHAVANKKQAEAMVAEARVASTATESTPRSTLPLIPILIKADVLGTLDAIQHELKTFQSDRIEVRVIDATVGNITSADVQSISATKNAIIVGFNVKVERAAIDLAERLGVEINTFNIIYELSEWLNSALKERTPKRQEEVNTGTIKVLRHFSSQKNTHVLGCRLEEGVVKKGQTARALRREVELGRGTISNLQQLKAAVDEVRDGEFGLQIESKVAIAPGDIIEVYDTVVT